MLAGVVERHLGSGDWIVREVPPIELLFPPGGPRVLEAAGGETPPQGILVLDDGSSWHLNTPEGTDAFLARVAPALDPLGVVLTLVRYRVPALAGARSARLATRPDDLDAAVSGVPLGLDVDGDRITFTAAYDQPAGAGRWTAVVGDAPALERV